MRGLTGQSGPYRFPFSSPTLTPISAPDSWVYILAKQVQVPLRAQHLCLLPPELLHLSFHNVHLRGKGPVGERPTDLGTGITLEAPEQGVRRGEGILPARGDLIHSDWHQEPSTMGLSFSNPRSCWITWPRLGFTAPNPKDLK